jgi:hypothetical protein
VDESNTLIRPPANATFEVGTARRAVRGRLGEASLPFDGRRMEILPSCPNSIFRRLFLGDAPPHPIPLLQREGEWSSAGCAYGQQN